MPYNCAKCGKPAPTWVSEAHLAIQGIVYHRECNPRPLGKWSHFIKGWKEE